jgi:hypothetical protein
VKWLNGTIYPCKKIGTYPQVYVERVMHGKYRGIAIQVFETKGGIGTTLSMTTRATRLLIKRLILAMED